LLNSDKYYSEITWLFSLLAGSIDSIGKAKDCLLKAPMPLYWISILELIPMLPHLLLPSVVYALVWVCRPINYKLLLASLRPILLELDRDLSLLNSKMQLARRWEKEGISSALLLADQEDVDGLISPWLDILIWSMDTVHLTLPNLIFWTHSRISK
jgi:hypothetical protein